ncbi:MAG: hypothetical protein ACRC7S_09065 [Cetobacterium sp.]
MKYKLVKISEHFKINSDTMEKVEGIITMDADYFDGNLKPENIAKLSRDALISIINDLNELLPSSHFNHIHKYEEDKLQNEDF